MVSKWTYIYHAILHACADKLSVQLYQVQFTHQHVFQEALFFFLHVLQKNFAVVSSTMVWIAGILF